MRVLVTGHTGFVGGRCASALLAAGFEVVGLSRRRSELPGLAGELSVDLADVRGLAEAAGRLGACDAILHCAACTSRDDRTPELVATNCLGTQQLIGMAQQHSVARFVFISGVTVIGSPRRTPIDEAHRTEPRSAYLASKLFGEHLLAAATREGLAGLSLRLTAPVGPSMPTGRMLRVFADRAVRGEELTVLGRGSRRQNYVHVDDVAAATALALETQASGVLNIGGPSSISNLELAQMCISRAGSSSGIVHHGTDPEEGIDWEISIEAAERKLGYRPSWGIAHTIDELVAAARG